jgi:hypothetical protein
MTDRNNFIVFATVSCYSAVSKGAEIRGFFELASPRGLEPLFSP